MADYSVHDHPNYNVPNLKLNNIYGNTGMNWMSNCGTPKFMPSHMNDVLVETWEDLNISYISITQGAFKKTYRIPLFSSYQYTNLQDLL